LKNSEAIFAGWGDDLLLLSKAVCIVERQLSQSKESFFLQRRKAICEEKEGNFLKRREAICFCRVGRLFCRVGDLCIVRWKFLKRKEAVFAE
jgi:hypothetical protein